MRVPLIRRALWAMALASAAAPGGQAGAQPAA